MELPKIPRERRELNDEVRTTAPGRFAALSEGMTHYELAGPEVTFTTAPVVLVHGLSVPNTVWEPTFLGLSDAGFRVLRYDLFGRGYSDRPRARYDLNLFVHQLRDLIDVLGLATPVDLVGLSLGGAVTVGFTDRYPALVRRLALIAPAGYPMAMPSGMALLRVPLLGELIMATVGRRALISALARDVNTGHKYAEAAWLPELTRRYLDQMQYRGFRRALLSTLRYGPLQNMADVYTRVGRHTRPVLVIWGREDRTVPYELSDRLRRAMPRAEFHAIEGAGHAPHLEQPHVVNRLLIGFFERRT